MKNKSDLRIIDSGQYLPKMLKDRKDIIIHGKNARMSESRLNIDMAFDEWCKVSGLIYEFEKNYFDPKKIQWAKSQGFFRFSKTFIIGFLQEF